MRSPHSVLASNVPPKDKERDPDFALVRTCQLAEDDTFESSFEELYVRYRDRVYSIAFRMTGTSSDALDVVQDAFSLLFRKIGGFRFDSLFSTWMFRIVVNCCIDHQRQLRGRSGREVSSLDGLRSSREPSDPGASPVERAQSSELGHHIHDSLQRLSPKLRAVMVLRYLEDLSYEQLAQALEVSIGTIKSRLARAHIALENVLTGTMTAFGYPELDQISGRGGEGVA